MGWPAAFRQRLMPTTLIPHRTLFGINTPKPLLPFDLKNKTQKYAEQRLLGYSSVLHWKEPSYN